MSAGTIKSSDLDEYVATCDQLGGVQSPDCAAYLSDFKLSLDTVVDEDLDPFSDEYFSQQMDVYREISGRDLDQETGEQAAVDVMTNSLTANPVGSGDIGNIAKHSKTIATLLSLSEIPTNAKILDLGAGWGLSSEIMAFCGASVTAVDINPLFVDLINNRAEHKNLPIKAKLSNFDDYEDDEIYDLAVFYECLHHSVKVWETLEHIGHLIKPNGKIAIAGEPIVDYWKHWGLRTDCMSVYCIKKFGWFESGWSRGFLTKAFERAGFDLQLTAHESFGWSYIGLATRLGEGNPLNAGIHFDSLISDNHLLASQHHELAQSYHVLAQQHHALNQSHILLNSRPEIKVGNALRTVLRPAKRLYEKIK